MIIAALLLAASVNAQDFSKIYKPMIRQDLVSFNGVPADFEYPPLLIGSRIFVNLTDLIRHVSGILVWGDKYNDLFASARGVDLLPGIPLTQFEGMHYVPLRQTAEMVGCPVRWQHGRADVKVRK